MSVRGKLIESVVNVSSEDAIFASKKIIQNLLLVCKNLSIYPSGHKICINSINQFHIELSRFIQKYGNLKIEIERERVIANGEVVFSGQPEEGALYFALFRDGIQFIEFTDGIEQEELHDILMVVNKYTKLSAEPEGDIVTAFWEAQFPHMKYDIAEFFWRKNQDTGCLSSNFMPQKEDGAQLRENNLENSESESSPAIDQASITLTQQEKAILMEMVAQGEDVNLTSYLDVLLDSLLLNQDKENFSVILEVLSEEFTGSLARNDFIVTLKILEGLQQVFEACKQETAWASSALESFLQNASGVDSLGPLKEFWRHIKTEDAETLGQIFRLLNPKAVHTLVSLLSQPQPLAVRQMLLDSITSLASRDMHPLESILWSSDDKLVESLVPVVASLPGDQPLQYLMKLTRHPAPQVVRKAVEGIFKRNPGCVKDVFFLIDNKNDFIRQLVLKQMGQTRDKVVEELLLSYLEKTKFSINEENHIILCFRTLGKCGSSRSVAFLRETLFRWGWMAVFGKIAYRRGAVMALRELGIHEADEVLEHARRSLYPSLRRIIRKVPQGL